MKNRSIKTPRPFAVDWLVGGGEMGALIRARDWSDTPLGSIETWPQSLRSAVSILLPSKAQIVLFWGPDLVTIYNDAYRPVFGGKHPAALGMPARQCWSEVWDVLEPLFQNVVRTGEAFWAKDHLFGLERHGYVEETYFDVSYDPVRDETGKVGGLFCIVSETTGRIVGERRLAALRDLGRVGNDASSAAEVFRNVATALRRYQRDVPFALLYRWDAARGTAHLEASAGLARGDAGAPERIEIANRGSLWPVGEDTELLLAEPFSELRLPESWPEPVDQAVVLKIGIPGKEPYGYLVAGISARRKFDNDYADFLRLLASNIASATAGVLALEEERSRAAQLAALDAAKTAFFSNVSHEFRTPLTLMLGPLEDVLERTAADGSSDYRPQLLTAHRNGQRLLKLVNVLLDFARIEAGRVRVAYESTDLALLTTDLASNFRSACERAGLHLIVDCPPLPGDVYVDREMWEKIVLNLLSNAFKFTLEGGIAVRLRATGANVELSVTDTGSGIPAEELPRMFERFHRVEHAQGRSHEGSGIGLALVNELVKLHGGSIAVESTPGQGSTFTVTLPQGSAHLPVAHIKPAREPASPGATRADAYVTEVLGWLPEGQSPAVPRRPQFTQRILVADDNADMREYARRLLSEYYEVHLVGDGHAALEAARVLRPDLIISDVMMPRLDGFGLIRELRADPGLRSIPVLLLSARAGEEARLEGLGKGADDYLVKPFNARELLLRVGTILRSADMYREAREARAQFETLLNEAPLGVYLVDDSFRIAAVNPTALSVFGDIKELIGRDFDEVIRILWPKAYADEVVGIFRRTLATGEPHVVPERSEERLDRGVIEYYEWQVNRIPLPGNRYGVVCYFRDISKFVIAREGLREADDRKDEFLATLSHELRNPLAPLRSALEVLKIGGTGNGSSHAALDIMGRQVSHLVRLVDDLLEVSRITRGSFELRKEPVKLAPVLRNAIESAEAMIRAGGHRLTVSITDESIVLRADPVRLTQIFGNLLNNAAKYSEPGGSITVEMRREANDAVVTIGDTGDGIEPGQLAQLFKIFVRGDRSAKRHQSGLGIGLALVRRLTEMHGGTVEAESAGAGKGSRFTVRLPVEHAGFFSAAEMEAATLAAASIRILVVDDNQDAADSLGMLLHQGGAEVTVAHNGPQALVECAACRPHIVLLDIGMPGMDGYEVARRLRAAPQDPRPFIVALTGWGQDEDRRRAGEAGFDHHLVKPADLEALRSLIDAIRVRGN